MNKKRILKSTSRLLIVEALLLLFPLICAFIYNEPWVVKRAFLISILLIVGVSIPFEFMKTEAKNLYASEGFIIVTLAWILLSFFGGLPLYFSGQYETLVDTFFEISSGFTTAGSSVLADVSHLTHSIILWKSITQLIGGMGVLVFALAIIPNTDKTDIHLMRAESPGPKFGKVVSKLRDTAIILYKMYFGLVVVLVAALMLAGMNFFDAITHGFQTAGTGGFSIYNGSVGYYDSVAIEMVIAVGMLVFSVNFALYHFILLKKSNYFFKSEELRWFIGIVAVTTIAIALNIAPDLGLLEAFRHSFFTVSSIISTTGYTSMDYNSWPLFSHIILLVLMMIGGMAGSTAGGLKVVRVATAIKSSFTEIKRSRNPKRIIKLKFENEGLTDAYLKSLKNYFTLYVLIFLFLVLCVSFDLPDLMSAFSAVASTFNNVGPGIALVGPSSSFGMLSDVNKVLLGFGMIAGRLEIIPMIVLFTPETWKKI